jgi:RNA polymerase sigma factor (sigma-70 family)
MMMSQTHAGRETDLGAFAARHGDALMRHAYLLTGSAHRAEDLVQDTLVSIAKTDFANIEHPLAYARRSLLNLFLNEQRRLPLAKAALRLWTPIAEAGVADDVIEREAVRQALQHLKPRQRAVIILRYYEDLNDADIAEALHCGPSTVRSLLARARTRLRDQLAEDLLDESGGV